MKMSVDGEKKLGRDGSQVKLQLYLAFFLFLVESARHFYNTTVSILINFNGVEIGAAQTTMLEKKWKVWVGQFVPVAVRIKGGGRDA